MKRYLLGGLSVLVVLAALLGLALSQSAKRVDSSKCRANAAEVGLHVERMLFARRYLDILPSAGDAYYGSADEARSLMAYRIGLDCATDLEPCNRELADVMNLRVKSRDAELAACQTLTGIEQYVSPDKTPKPAQDG